MGILDYAEAGYTAAIFKFTGSSLNLSEYFKVRGGNEQKTQRMVTEEEKKTLLLKDKY